MNIYTEDEALIELLEVKWVAPMTKDTKDFLRMLLKVI